MKIGMVIVVSLLAAFVMAQDKPEKIAKEKLPAASVCLVCQEGAEKPAGGFMYKGKAYYFCNTKEMASFEKDPDSLIPPVLPRPMPKFELSDLGGKAWDTEALKGKLVLVDYWATWCKPCIEMFPKVDKLREKYGEKGFEVLSVSIDEKRADLDKFLAKRKFPNPVLHDTKQTWNDWGIKAIPAMFLVKDGQVVAQWIGKVDDKVIAEAIEANLAK
jgi:thiol-disulfide isomerase/thioredoxin